MTNNPHAEHKKPSGAVMALQWAALLAVVALGAWGIYELATDEVVLVDPAAAPTDGATAGATEGATDSATPGAEGGAGSGTIAAGGATVYPLQEDLTLRDYAGTDVVASGVPVESVAGDGFWVGTTKKDRVYVVAPDAQVEPGATVSFEGVVRKHGKNYAKSVGVSNKEGAKRLNNLGGHIEATEVTTG